MSATRKLLLLPGDGIGPEVMREARRIIDWLERKRGIVFELEEDVVGGASIDTRGTPLAESTLALAKAADAVLFGAVGGPRVGQARLRQAPRNRHPRPAPRTRPVRQPAPCHCLRPAGLRQHAEARNRAGPRHHDRPREHRRHLFRRAPRHHHAAGRPAPRHQHGGLHHRRNRARRPRRVRSRPQAAKPCRQRRKIQCHGERPALAPGHYFVAQHGIQGCGADPRAGRQLRHAARARAETVRRDRHRQPVRRHPE